MTWVSEFFSLWGTSNHDVSTVGIVTLLSVERLPDVVSSDSTSYKFVVSLVFFAGGRVRSKVLCQVSVC